MAEPVDELAMPELVRLLLGSEHAPGTGEYSGVDLDILGHKPNAPWTRRDDEVMFN